NCLMDACLLNMIGIQDSSLKLRRHLFNYIKANETAIHDMWRYSRVAFDQELGIDLEDSILEEEWKQIVEETEVVDGGRCKFLQSCHIFAAANMLKRPIIVLGEEYINTANESNIQLNDIIGVYLTLLSASINTSHYPILLAYVSSHFTPLVMLKKQSSASTTSDTTTALQSSLPLSFLSNSILVRDLPVHYLNYIEQRSLS
ncbi:unnamed protein product, partial [Didymodactylos carnosus]